MSPKLAIFAVSVGSTVIVSNGIFSLYLHVQQLSTECQSFSPNDPEEFACFGETAGVMVFFVVRDRLRDLRVEPLTDLNASR